MLSLLQLSLTVTLFVASVATLEHRPAFQVPGLVQIRDILSQLEAPIVSALTERINLPSNPSLYKDGEHGLLPFLREYEVTASLTGRYNYGKLEYPYVIPNIPADKTTASTPFPPGQFHQDNFTGNSDLLKFYVETLVPMFHSPTAYYFHLDNSTINSDAVLSLDAMVLSLISHRAHIGKIVAETKFASNVTVFTSFIQQNDVKSIRDAVTNTTQKAGVLSQASNAAAAFAGAWATSGALLSGSFANDLQNATETLFRKLINVTTEIEIQYLLRRFD